MNTEIKNILVPYSFSEKSKNALKVAAKMAIRHEAKLIITHVVPTDFLIDHSGKQVIGSQVVQENIDNCRSKLDKVRSKLLEKFNLNIEVSIKTQNIVDTINDYVFKKDIDLVVMGTSGRQNVKQLFLGSNSYNVLLYANCSVLLIPENFQKTDFKKILFPVRVQHELHQKADISMLLAQKNEGGIALLGVGKPNKLKAVRKSFMEMKKNLGQNNAEYSAEFKLSKNTAGSICKAAAEKESDIIILADQDEENWKSVISENFFKKMINESEVPLLIVKSKLKKLKKTPTPQNNYDLTMPIPG